MKSKVSVIIPNYNGEKYIERCLNSLINQRYENIEIIIIDDGSSDNSVKICNDYFKKDKRVKVFSKENGGPSSARNFGLKKAKGDYLIFVDSDDVLHENAIQQMINSIGNNDIVISNYNYLYSDNSIKNNKKYINKNYDFIEFITVNECWEPWGKLVRKECIKKVFNDNYHIGEDLLFWFENSNFINNYSVIEDYTYDYFINENSIMHSSSKNNKLNDSLKMIDYIIDNNKSTVLDERMKFLYFSTVYKLKKKVEFSKDNIKKFNNYLFYILKSPNIKFKDKFKAIIKFVLFKIS